jgi:hypothetical protein
MLMPIENCASDAGSVEKSHPVQESFTEESHAENLHSKPPVEHIRAWLHRFIAEHSLMASPPSTALKGPLYELRARSSGAIVFCFTMDNGNT